MARSSRQICILATFACLGDGFPDDVPKKADPAAAAPWNEINAAFKKLEGADNDWRAEQVACEALASGGDRALHVIQDGAEKHEKTRVRRACYKLLTHEFAKNPWALPTVIRSGLSDKDDWIRYENAFQLGELKAYESFRDLKRVLVETRENPALRFAAAKSLAQLGEADSDVLRTLFEAVTYEGYMARKMGSVGLKALSGKNLDDFAGYHFGEGAFVSGGREAVGTFDAVRVSETRARRYAAAEAYFKWLQKDRPDLYKYLSGAF
jgi:HEAT repeats